MTKFLIRTLSAAAVLAAISPAVHAESTVVNGAGALTTSARLDFRVTVPQVLFLQVGTGALFSTNAAINLIDFVVPATNVGDNTPIPATAGSGDLGNGAVTARVVGNNGNVTLTATTLGPLINGAGDTLSYSMISTTPTALNTATALVAPALVDGGTTSTVVPATGKIVNRDARWTFSFANSAAVPPGTYGGVNANNSRVTYTASMP